MPVIHAFLPNFFRAERLQPNLQGTGVTCLQDSGGILPDPDSNNNKKTVMTNKRICQEFPNYHFFVVWADRLINAYI